VLERAAVARADLDHATANTREGPAPELACLEVRLALLSPLEVAGKSRLLRPVERRPRRNNAGTMSAPG
jgi:hypothetical protein